METIDEKVAQLADSGGKERLVPLFFQVLTTAEDVEDKQSLYLLEYSLHVIAAHLKTNFNVKLSWYKLIGNDIDVEVEKKEVDDEEVENNDNEFEDDTTMSLISGDPSTTYSLSGFYEAYKGYVTSMTAFDKLCMKYYDKIDEIAKEYDFPTALIVATWWREHTCKFENPANGRGNFQITSHYYSAGEIDRDDFENQVINFIVFSKAKWDYYDDVQTFGEEPIALSYDTLDLTSLRKHAIFYNGIRGELDTNIYANQNFARPADGRDGIVAMTLRALWWQLYKDATSVLQTEEIAWEDKGVKEELDEEVSEPWNEVDEEELDEEVIIETEEDCDEASFTVDLWPGANHPEVLAMQEFLVDQWWYIGDPSGMYDDKTTQAVSAFQAYYKEDILDPGGYTSPTGYRYPATRRKANTLVCE